MIKQYIRDGGYDALGAFLQEHAVPKFFDRVDIVGTEINCYIGDAIMLRFYINSSNKQVAEVHPVNGSLSMSGVTISNGLRWAYTMPAGINLSSEDDGRFTITICKDSNDSTVIIWMPAMTYAMSAKEYMCIGEDSIDAKGITLAARDGMDQRTMLAPFMIRNAEGTITPDALILLYTQYTNPGIITIDGIKYHSNGVWVLRAE